MIRMALELGVDRVKGHHLWAHFKEIRDQDMRRSAESIARWNAVVAECQAVAQDEFKRSGKKVCAP
jgi:hypothetical protein